MRGDFDIDIQDVQDAQVSQLVSGKSRSHAYGRIKRILDLIMSTIVLAITAPLWVLIALAIKIDSTGSVIFRQRRIGVDGQEFVMYKFRTMFNDADPALHKEAFRKYVNGEQPKIDEDGSAFKDAQDPRVTRSGRILRATNLDELPQLVNVLKGDMSIVGPRPAIQYELQWYKDWHHNRFQVLPGITGLWQVSKGRFQVGLEEMVLLDLEYIWKRNIILDMKIIVFTVIHILKGFTSTVSQIRGKS